MWIRSAHGAWILVVRCLQSTSRLSEEVHQFAKRFRRAGESLRRFLAPPPRRRPVLSYPARIAGTTERSPPLARCPTCGALTPRDARLMRSLRRGIRSTGRCASAASTSDPSGSHNTTKQCIVTLSRRPGEISLSKASADLQHDRSLNSKPQYEDSKIQERSRETARREASQSTRAGGSPYGGSAPSFRYYFFLSLWMYVSSLKVLRRIGQGSLPFLSGDGQLSRSPC